MRVLGIVLMLAGAVVLAYGHFSWTTHSPAAHAGPLHWETTRHHTVPLPPLLGVSGLLIGGIVLVTSGKGN